VVRSSVYVYVLFGHGSGVQGNTPLDVAKESVVPLLRQKSDLLIKSAAQGAGDAAQ